MGEIPEPRSPAQPSAEIRLHTLLGPGRDPTPEQLVEELGLWERPPSPRRAPACCST